MQLAFFVLQKNKQLNICLNTHKKLKHYFKKKKRHTIIQLYASLTKYKLNEHYKYRVLN